MIHKLMVGLFATLFVASVHAASDAPSGYTKCAQIGATCTMTGTRQAALGKSGSFVYATKTGSFACTNAAFPANSYATSAWCSYAGTTSASSSTASSTASSVASSTSSSKSSSSSSKASSSVASGAGFVGTHGTLRTVGNQLVNKNGAAVQLRGMSSHGLAWWGNYMNANSIKWMRDDWGINVIRAAMYTTGANDGYIYKPSITTKVYEMIDAAIALNIYVIVDWHILSDGNPQTYKAQAKTFFAEVSKKYGNIPNIIYEIANEPNGSGVTWNAAIRPYAQEVIPVIRANAPNALVIVGTGTWSQDVTDAAANPVTFANVAYTVHFYACTHGQGLRDKIDAARAKGVTIFSTEWGTGDASGAGSVCDSLTRTWITFMNSRGISWVNWSVAPLTEATAALKSGASVNGGWTASNLSTSGILVKSLMR